MPEQAEALGEVGPGGAPRIGEGTHYAPEPHPKVCRWGSHGRCSPSAGRSAAANMAKGPILSRPSCVLQGHSRPTGCILWPARDWKALEDGPALLCHSLLPAPGMAQGVGTPDSAQRPALPGLIHPWPSLSPALILSPRYLSLAADPQPLSATHGLLGLMPVEALQEWWGGCCGSSPRVPPAPHTSRIRPIFAYAAV